MDYKDKVISLLNSQELSKEQKKKLEDVFPELQETNDERIRKGIIRNLEYLMDRAEGFVKDELKERIAWLEKQGNNMGISEATKKKLEDNLNRALEKETPESFNEFLDEQGEQKMKTPEESLGIDSDTYNKIVDECIYGKEPELVDADDLPKEEPASEIDFEQELYKAFGQVKDFTLGMRIAKWFYDMGKNNQEHVSEDLGEYINELSKQFPEVSFAKLSRIAVRVAKWQGEKDVKKIKTAIDFSFHGGRCQKEEEMLKNAIDVEVKVDAGGYPYIPQMELCDYDKDEPLAKEGDKYKVVLIKDD